MTEKGKKLDCRLQQLVENAKFVIRTLPFQLEVFSLLKQLQVFLYIRSIVFPRVQVYYEHQQAHYGKPQFQLLAEEKDQTKVNLDIKGPSTKYEAREVPY